MKLHADLPPADVAFPETLAAGLAHPALLSVHDVCVELQCGRTFVYELLQKRELLAIKLGRLTRISRKELDAFLEGKETATTDRSGQTFGVGASAGPVNGSPSVARRRRLTPSRGGASTSALAAGIQQPLLLDPAESLPRPDGASPCPARTPDAKCLETRGTSVRLHR
jgi:excisionase family DNA binding protein